MKSYWRVLAILLISGSSAVAQQMPDSRTQGTRPYNSSGSQDCDPNLLGQDCQTEETGAQQRLPQTNQQQQDVRLPHLANPRQDTTQYPEDLNNPASRPSQRRLMNPPQPRTEFEQMVADSVGRVLPMFGQSLFTEVPSTFAPTDRVQVPSDYVVGPGDELQIRIWGQVDADLRTNVDRSGTVYIPHVGPVGVAGVSYNDLPAHLRAEVSKIYKNFELTVSIGRLRSIQVIVVGQARFPGTYTVGSLSSLVNALFACGGPSAQGSLRNIEVRREGKTVSIFDFYDLLIKGDKSKDVRLQSGDVIYIPHVGPLAAISGSVNVPAIYEAKNSTSLAELVELAGGLSAVADTSRIVVERIADHQVRKVVEFPLDQQAQAFAVNDGDIVRVFSIVPRFDDAVTLRGSVTNPGRYPWKPGMKIRDLIPSASSLLTRSYWLNRASISNGRATEYPTRQTQRVKPPTSEPLGADSQFNTERPANPQLPNPQLPANQQQQSIYDASQEGELRNQDNPVYTRKQITGQTLATDLRKYAPEINWHYATVQRVNPTDLSTKLLSFDLEKAVLQGGEQDNLELQAGDIVTVFSQTDIGIPQDQRSRYVILEGEVMRPGVYKVEPGETLPTLLNRAGGVSPNAYIYGIELTRESARIEQQKSLDELVRTLELQAAQPQSASGSTDSQMLAARQAFQQSLVAQTRRLQATGRVVLNVEPGVKSIDELPDVQMEDDDKVNIPHVPSTVAVVGFVYNPGSFLFDSRGTAGRYLKLAGNTRPQADMKHAFVLRANGTVVARTSVNGLFSGDQFSSLRLHPGDQVVVPNKLETGAWVRGLRDWTQIASQLALTGAALAVIH
jgi:polysaccharide biosynthesis/export protein